MNKNKLLFWAAWVLLVSMVPLTILNGTGMPLATSPVLLANLAQRVLGLLVFVLLFSQLMIGANMHWFIDKLGAWVFKFHIVEGVTIYTLVVLHTIGFLLFNYFSGKGFDPFYVFLGFCILCENATELLYTLGRISFWLLTIAVFAGLLRTATPFLRIHWRKFHVLNYLVFLLVGVHGFFVGTDFRTMPFFIVGAGAYLFVLMIVIKRALISYKRQWD
ncbi:MAG TPA: hypothetical protein VJ227_04380 [Patescibacteria group bacterium]|nr:hypothetical protein [Patescibacteria group bacterium]